MTRSELIDLFIVRAAPADRPELRRTLEQMTKEQLEEAHKIIQLQAKEDEVLQINAERAANLALYKHLQQQAREPQRKAEEKAQLAKDRQTFADAAKSLRRFALNDANFNVVRRTLGAGFSVYQIRELVAANGATLAPPTQEELNGWEREAIEAHNLRLLGADIPTLRKLARDAGARGKAAPQPDETQRVRQAERADGFTYPPLPDEIRIGDGAEELLDSAFLQRCSKETLRFLIKRYGADQINEALRTRRPEVSPLWLA